MSDSDSAAPLINDEKLMERPKNPPPKRPGRKKVSKKKQINRPKARGKYCPDQDIKEAKQLTVDIAECIFSDEEERRDYVEQTWGIDSDASSASVQLSSEISVDSSALGSTHESTTSEMDGHETSSVSTTFESDSSMQSSTPDSRPSSALSRPESSADCAAFNPDAVDEPDLNPSADFINKGVQRMNALLPPSWTTVGDQTGFHFFLLSPKFPKAIQREVFISFGGNVLASVHCALLPSQNRVLGLESTVPVQFRDDLFEQYCIFCVNIVKHFMQYSVCIGANDMETRDVWAELIGGKIDSNPYKEETYSETFRSETCEWVIKLGFGKRCKNCSQLLKNMSKRRSFLLSATADPSAANKYLTKQQRAAKLKEQQAAIKKKDKQIAYLKNRCREILEAEGCNIDDELNEFFSTVLASSKLSPNQQMFLNEQWASSNKTDSRSHRWHPAMIRFALHLHMVSSAAYETLRDSGVIRLPCARTLYDYTHSIKATNGVNPGLVELVHDTLQKFEEPCKQYHNLLCDGMHISQNLVFRSTDGSLVGVTHMDDIDKEMEVFEKYVEGKEAVLSEPQLATEMLAYMVKGIATDVKVTIAAYPCKILTKEMLYKRTWEVISICEKAGIKILAFVCDGLSINRAFFLMHTPLTRTESGLVFDTLNFCSPELRPLFFVSDVCHLLKTIRNCFYNSGDGKKKTRLMTLNGQVIQWKSIVHLYFKYQQNNFRKSTKLNPQNVFPTPYSRMKVRYAAQVLSTTVANDMESQNWDDHEEVIRFIRLCDKFFDVLNGAHSSQTNRFLKPDLAPYDSLDDPRFDWLENTFQKYFEDWKAQVKSNRNIDATAQEKMMLSRQTLEGIEITVKAIIAATKYFLDPEKPVKGEFLMARCFSQDPLEQDFGKQRAGGGGSRHPNASQFQAKMVPLALQRELGIKRRRGNVTAEQAGEITWSNESLPKRPRNTTRKRCK